MQLPALRAAADAERWTNWVDQARHMEDLLPDIGIRIREAPFTVLARLESIAREKNWATHLEPWDITEGRGRVLVLTPSLGLPHEDLCGLVIAKGDSVTRLRVAVRASSWSPDPATYTAYVAAAKATMRPILNTYASQFLQRYRLGITRRQTLQPKLPRAARKVFDAFLSEANKTALHPLDWERFYFFIRHCSAHRVHCRPDDVQRLLTRAGFREEPAQCMASIYEHGRELLKPIWRKNPDW